MHCVEEFSERFDPFNKYGAKCFLGDAPSRTIKDKHPEIVNLDENPTFAILDLGCGVGDSAVRMRNAGFTVSCTDASPEMVATANELHGLDAVQKSFSELREEAAYNAVWASFSLLHAPRAEMPANLARIHRAILPGGLFYMGLKLGAGEARDAAGRFYAYFGEEELRRMLAEAGFSVLAAEPDSMVGLLGSPEPCIHITSARD